MRIAGSESWICTLTDPNLEADPGGKKLPKRKRNSYKVNVEFFVSVFSTIASRRRRRNRDQSGLSFMDLAAGI